MKTYEAIEAMVIPVGGEPETTLLVSDENGSFRGAVERILGGEAEAVAWPFGDSPAMFRCGGRTAPRTFADANRAIYADAAMADAGVKSPAEPWRGVREGELYDIAFGPLVCVGVAGEWGGCCGLTEDEKERIAERFGGAESIVSGTREALRAAFGAGHSEKDTTDLQKGDRTMTETTRGEKLAAKVGDARAKVVERVLAMMERDGLDWIRGWSSPSCAPRNAETGRRYTGGNRLHLMGLYDDPRWMTFNQARKQGYFPRRGERSEIVEYWKPMRAYLDAKGNLVALRKGEEPPDGAEAVTRMRLAGVFHVFNVDQLADREGNPYPPLEAAPPDSPAAESPLAETADRLIASSRCPVHEGRSNQACYSPASDAVALPARAKFRSMESFVATLTHEIGHATAPALGRDARGPFGSAPYAREELVAELASLFCCLDLGVEKTGELESDANSANHAAYRKSWMAALHDDPAHLFRAAADADRAAAYIMGRYATAAEEAA